MEGPGTMSWEEFITDAKSIVKLSKEINDKWELIGDKNSPGTAYLSREIKTYVPCDYLLENQEEEEEKDSLENLEFFKIQNDPFEAFSNKEERPLITIHHILWSMSYGVPVLYFNGFKSDFPGSNIIGVQTAQRIMGNDVLGYSELSQAIHPVLGKPFLHLHPCKSKELLQQFFKSKNKLVSWLSAVAPSALGLKLNENYYKLTI